MATTKKDSLGRLIRDVRVRRGWTMEHLAEVSNVELATVMAVESGENFEEHVLILISQVLQGNAESERAAIPCLRIQGSAVLSGAIEIKASKNASVALLCGSLLNRGRTTIRNIARIEEVNRIIEVLSSIGVAVSWDPTGRDVTLLPPSHLNLESIDLSAARRTRSILMLLGPLIHRESNFELPFAGGCDLGTRTVEPHMVAMRPFGLAVDVRDGFYKAVVSKRDSVKERTIVLIERGDTVTENALMAAAGEAGQTVIKNASSNYMVQDLCFFLQELGVSIEGIGTTTLKVKGVEQIDVDAVITPSEDPIEAMSFLTAAIVTHSQITIRRAPIEFLEIELAILEEMGFLYSRSPEYSSANGKTRLVDLTTFPSEFKAPVDKIHPMPFPGLNIDNLPFFAAIAATAVGGTMLHDWVYDNRAIYLTDLNRLGASVSLLDPHRVFVTGPTHWSGTEMVCPPALRPAVVLMLAMVAAKGPSTLRNIYVIERGYEDFTERLNSLGAGITVFYDHGI